MVYSESRKKWIDSAKGLAMLMIIAGHAGNGHVAVRWVYGVHLVMFFLLSGYTFRKKPLTRDYLNRRFVRLMVPYFWTCLAILVMDVLMAYGGTTAVITEIIRHDLIRSFFASGVITNFGNIELGTRIGAIWFLPALYFASIFFQIILHHCNGNDSLAGLISAVLAIFAHISGRFIWFPFSIQSGMMAVFFMWLGYEIREKNLLSRLRRWHYPCALIILLLGYYLDYCNIAFVVANANDLLLSLMTGLAGCILVYGIAVRYRGNLLATIGRISLTVLCTHLFALETLGRPFTAVISGLGLGGTAFTFAFILLEILFAVLTAAAIEALKPLFHRIQVFLFSRERALLSSPVLRDDTADIARGILILFIILGDFVIDSGLRNIIISCHIAGFVFLLGYSSFREEHDLPSSVGQAAKSFLFPYLLVALASVFSEFPSAGPAYLFPLLFCTQVLYFFIERFLKREDLRRVAVIALSLIGFRLGKLGFWLPWSFDAACYCLIFYMSGFLFRQKDWLSRVKEDHFAYFVLSTVWAYMIYAGSMDIADRSYSSYSITVLGALAGTLLVVKLSSFIADRLPLCKAFLRVSGEASIAILTVHALVNRNFHSCFERWFDPEYIPCLMVSIAVPVVLGILIHLGVRFIRRLTNRERL